MNFPASDDEKLATHETGHALMFDALGVPISFVTISAGCEGEESSYEGCVKLALDSNSVADVIAGTLAGPGASFFIAHVPANKQAMEQFSSDQLKIYQIHNKQKDAGSYNEFWGRLQLFLSTWLKAWLIQHQESIHRFASELLEKRTLSGEELEQALTSAWAGSKPDTYTLRSDVVATLNRISNNNQSLESQETEPSNSGGEPCSYSV